MLRDLRSYLVPKKLNNDDQFNEYSDVTMTSDLVWIDHVREIDGIHRVSPTDYALAGFVFTRNGYSSIDGKEITADYFLRSIADTEEGSLNYIQDEGVGTVGVGDDSTTILPVMQLDAKSVIDARSSGANQFDIYDVKNLKNEVSHIITFGEFPHTKVSGDLYTQLENCHEAGVDTLLKDTNRAYLGYIDRTDGEVVHAYNFEYTYGGNKYVRVISHEECDSNDDKYSDGSYVENNEILWFDVRPIKWQILNWDNLPKELNPNGSGEASTILVRPAEAIIGHIPYYAGNDKDANCYLWQNSTIRGYLNGINVNNIKENGNPGYPAPNGGDFSVTQGFLAEALKVPVLSRDKSIEEDKSKKRSKGYGVQVLDHPMTVREQLQFYITNGKSFMLHGPSGVGKTRRIEEADPDFTSITLRNGILPEEVIGKTIYPNNDKTKAGTWVPPAWYVSLLDKCNAEPSKNHVLFIDEITNVKPVEQSLVFHLVLNNMIGPNVGPLPDNVVVVAAGNSKEESESAYTMTEPLFRRFDGHVYLRPDVHQFLEWGSEPHPKDSTRPKVHPLVANFVATYGDKVFYSPYDSEEPPKYAIDPRGWEQISDIIYDNHGIIAKELIENKVGADIASSFIAFASTPQITVEDVIDGTYSDEDIPSSFDAKYAMALSLRGVKEEHISDIRNFIHNELGSEVLSMFDTVWVGEDNERAILIDSLDIEEKVDNEDGTPTKHKYVMTVDEFWDAKEKLEIHTDKVWKANMLREVFDIMGKKWGTGEPYSSGASFFRYGEKTAYTNDGCYGCVDNGAGEYKTFDFYDVDYSKYLSPERLKQLEEERKAEELEDKIDDKSSADDSVSDGEYKITIDEFWGEDEDYSGIHCDAEWKYTILTKVFDRMGKTWRSGHSYKDKEYYAYHVNGIDSVMTNMRTCTGTYEKGVKVYDFYDVDLEKYTNASEDFLINTNRKNEKAMAEEDDEMELPF
ncbi:MAG: ATP-binding protein [Clostridiales bacterium]|nr:ATP-binding protein [Clostridiales bacterium]